MLINVGIHVRVKDKDMGQAHCKENDGIQWGWKQTHLINFYFILSYFNVIKSDDYYYYKSGSLVMLLNSK